MPQLYNLPPSASSLSESMRDIGYSLATAIADLIDNCITAEATEIDIICDLASDDPVLAVIDNGNGMTKDELLNAMKHGSVNPKYKRDPKDLGRFGLGLKTASFSQCRFLSVVSRKQSILSGATWDLDLISREDDWVLCIHEENDTRTLPYVDRLTSNGTIVVWNKLDRLFEDQGGTKREEIVNEKLDLVEKHLALVFHRFISGEINGRKKVTITINSHPVVAFDPFCRKNKATQMLPCEIVRVGDHDIVIQPYVLPHHSKLSAVEQDYYEDRSSFVSNQGVYVYRNHRLMVWGDWFRIIPKGENTKLARVQIDFTNALDENWTIDIKKSRAWPPQVVRDRLKQVISNISHSSTRVYRGRGQKLFEGSVAPIWERFADKGKIRYTLNTSHPIVNALKRELNESQYDSLIRYLDSIESALPVEMIYSDYSTNPRDLVPYVIPEDDVLERLKELSELLFADGLKNEAAFREVVSSTRLFADHQESLERFVREEFRDSYSGTDTG